MEKYDSHNDTLKHKIKVASLINDVISILSLRRRNHDESKLHEPEKSVFDEYTPRLKDLVYGSEEYRQNMKEMSEAIEHHNANNRHHPEHFADGMFGMTLIDLIEMLCDWKAATERSKDGNLGISIMYGIDRFKIDRQLASILENTCREMGWL